MSFSGWIIFATFWAVFVTTPGPNAVNCISNGMTFGLRRALWGVAAILTQATLFLTLSAFGVTALITASPAIFFFAKILGAGFLIWIGIRGWLTAATPPPATTPSHRIYLSALAIATFNAKSVAGYLAAFTQFVQTDVPVMDQMSVIMPTALTLTALSYTGYSLMGAVLGRTALGTVFAAGFRRFMAVCFILYGILLGGSVAGARA